MKIIKEIQDIEIKPIVWKLLGEIEMLISISGSEEALRDMMDVYVKHHPQFEKHLIYRFGRNHMWICLEGTWERILFVEF